jgi:hypothetical protein
MKVLLENFKEKIEDGDSQKALDALDLVIEKLPEDGDLITEILTPAIITELHELLIEHLEVQPRAMQLNRRFPNSKTRAVMFAKAMRNGISHTLRVTGEE